MLEQQINRILAEFRSDAVGTTSPQELRNKYLGRKNGVLTLLMKELQQVPPAEKPAAGKQINELKWSWKQAESLGGRCGDAGSLCTTPI
jgi:phenylalanyl-tRNA synthetase alpha subunit